MKILALGIDNEHEDGGPLWFRLDDMGLLKKYIENNVDLNQPRTFMIKEFSKAEFNKLDCE